VLGGLLVALAALGSYLIARRGGDDQLAPYVVAARDLAPGAAVSPADLRVVSLELPPEQARGTFPTVAALTGAVMRGPLQAGAVVTASAVDRPAPGTPTGEGLDAAADSAPATPAYRELSLDLAAARAVGGDLRPGDRVDVVATADAVTHVLVQQALVVRADGGNEGSPLGGAEVSVTLALPDAAAALAVAHGAAAAELTLLRSTRATQPLPDTYQLPGSTIRTGTGTGTGNAAASTAGAPGAGNAAASSGAVPATGGTAGGGR
jgi:Flp pilus assembly protein CpaB